MLIDWFTVAAQIVNFLILVWLLKRFLYQPILSAMDRREENMASRMEDARKRREEAEREAEAFRTRRQALDEKSSQLLAEAKDEAEKRRQEWTQEVRDEVERLRKRWFQRVLLQRETFLHDLRRRASEQVNAVARRALADLADADIERRMIDVFLERVAELDEKRRQAIAHSVEEGDRGIEISSAFEIVADQRKRITETMRRLVREGIDVRYHTIPEMILGIEMKTHGYKVAWSLDEYLESLEEEMARAMEAGAGEKSAR